METIDRELEYVKYSKQCLFCKHLKNRSEPDNLPACKAFPEGIPVEVWNNEKKHNKPIEGQTGEYVFEQKE